MVPLGRLRIVVDEEEEGVVRKPEEPRTFDEGFDLAVDILIG